MARLARTLHERNSSEVLWLALRLLGATMRMTIALGAVLWRAGTLGAAAVPLGIAAVGMMMMRRGFVRAGLPRPPVGRRDAHPDQTLDIAQISALLVIAERDRGAFGARARRAPDAVHVAFRHVRQIVVDHMADAVDVDAPRGDVSRDQRSQFAGAEGAEHALALVLRLVAVDRLGGGPPPFQPPPHLV